MAETGPTAYDSVAYPGFAHPHTHPSQIAAHARLYGLDAAPIETCRVLEVGCGDGANLIPMAASLPQAKFAGFDLAASAVARGRAFASELGLPNLCLEHRDILEAPDCMGEFDYILAHGFYSWVPPAARDKLLAVCRASLAPKGIAFISYNTLPGGHIRRMVREMMLLHTGGTPDPETKIQQARALVRLLGKLSADGDEDQAFLKSEFERVLNYTAAHLFHDDLSPIFECVYFHEFVAHSGRYGLQFLAEANASFLRTAELDEESKPFLAELETDRVLREQYLDFARCRRFRRTLLCRSEVPLSNQPQAERLTELFLSSDAGPVSEKPDVESGAEELFRNTRGTSLKTSHPLLKAALVTLYSVWPMRLSLEQLRVRSAAKLNLPLDQAPADLLVQGLLEVFSLRALELDTYSPQLTNDAGDCPQTSRWIRMQAARGEVVTNLIHHPVEIDEKGRQLLGLLDGQHTRAALAAEMDAPLDQIGRALKALARLGLLEA